MSMSTTKFRLDFYTTDRLNNRSGINTLYISIPPTTGVVDASTLPVASYLGTNNNDRILGTKKYPNNYPNSNPPAVPYPNQLPVATRFKEMKDMGLTTIRINMYWEGYRWYKSQGQARIFLDRLKEIADTADSLGLGILYNVMHQWKISSVLYSSSSKTNRGTGFPEEALQPLGLVRLPDSYVYDQTIDGSTDVMKMPKNIFYKNFVKNYNVTIGGVTKPIWQHIWDDYFRDVVMATKDRPSTIGYEMLNEPFEGCDNIMSTDYEGLGRYYSFIAQKIRGITRTKKIFFSELLSWRHNNEEINQRYPDLAGKDAHTKKVELTRRLLIPRYADGSYIENIVFLMNRYGTSSQGGLTQAQKDGIDAYIAMFDSLRSTIDIKIVIGEWNNWEKSIEPTTQHYVDYLTFYKNRGIGWFFFNYDPNYLWTIKDYYYNDRLNSAKTMTFKQMLVDAIKSVYAL